MRYHCKLSKRLRLRALEFAIALEDAIANARRNILRTPIADAVSGVDVISKRSDR